MKKYRLAPGNILVNWYIKKRIKATEPQSFVEIGAGVGITSLLFLKQGAKGHAYELNPESVKVNKEENHYWIESGKYCIHNENFLTGTIEGHCDVIFSHNVIEHLSDAELAQYFEKAKSIMNKGGRIISVVPAGMQYWGIEDEIAGHMKRYTIDDVREICQRHNFQIADLVYLTYPLSNMLKPLGDWLIRKNESVLLSAGQKEKTVNSSLRQVEMKTEFNGFFRIIINEIFLFPFIILQSLNKKNTNSMTMYFELEEKL